jgi:hypothetical protein
LFIYTPPDSFEISCHSVEFTAMYLVVKSELCT